MRRRIAELERKLAARPQAARAPRDPSEIEKGLRTQIRNLNARLRNATESRDEARAANPVAINKTQRGKLPRAIPSKI